LPCAAKFRKNDGSDESKEKAKVRHELKNYAALSEEPFSMENADVVRLVQVIFMMVRNMLPDAFWNISDPNYPFQTLERQFNEFIKRTSYNFVFEFGRQHLDRCFQIDTLNDPIYGPENQAEIDAKIAEKLEEKVAEVDASQRLAMAQAANTSHESLDWDWGNPNSAWDEAQ
jgi:hypothetical protein